MMSIKVATICLEVGSDPDHNFANAQRLLGEARDQGAKWIVLPEMFIANSTIEDLPGLAARVQSEFLPKLQKWCQKCEVTLFAGSLPRTAKNSEKGVYNSASIINRNGDIVAEYAKTHLFQLNTSDKKAKSVDESTRYIAGDSFLVSEIDGWRVGMGICFDLRFPEMFCKMAENKPLDVIVLPSAFTEFTGQYHWIPLLTARAIEQQCYVIASNQCGIPPYAPPQFGHSMIVDPWGLTIDDTGARSGIAWAMIDHAAITKARETVPTHLNRRVDLY